MFSNKKVFWFFKTKIKRLKMYRYSAHTFCVYRAIDTQIILSPLHVFVSNIFRFAAYFPTFPEILLARSRSLIKITMNGKFLKFQKDEAINFYLKTPILWPIRDSGQTLLIHFRFFFIFSFGSEEMEKTYPFCAHVLSWPFCDSV